MGEMHRGDCRPAVREDGPSDAKIPACFWHSSDKNLRSAPARRNQETVYSLVLQGNIRLLRTGVNACLIVSRQDRLP